MQSSIDFPSLPVKEETSVVKEEPKKAENYSTGTSQKIPQLKGFDNAIFSKTHGVPLSYDDWYSENEDHLLDIWNTCRV